MWHRKLQFKKSKAVLGTRNESRVLWITASNYRVLASCAALECIPANNQLGSRKYNMKSEIKANNSDEQKEIARI